MSISEDIFAFIHNKQGNGLGIIPYGAFQASAHQAAEATGQPEDICFAAMMLMRERGILRNDRRGLEVVSAENGAVVFMPPTEFAGQKTYPPNLPSDDEIISSGFREAGASGAVRRESLTPEVILENVRTKISSSPERYCREGIDLWGILKKDLNFGILQIRDAILMLERNFELIARSEGASDFWWAAEAPDSVCSAEAHPHSMLRLLDEC